MVSKNENSIKINGFQIKSDTYPKNPLPNKVNIFYLYFHRVRKILKIMVINQVIFPNIHIIPYIMKIQNMLELQIKMLQYFVILILMQFIYFWKK